MAHTDGQTRLLRKIAQFPDYAPSSHDPIATDSNPLSSALSPLELVAEKDIDLDLEYTHRALLEANPKLQIFLDRIQGSYAECPGEITDKLWPVIFKHEAILRAVAPEARQVRQRYHKS